MVSVMSATEGMVRVLPVRVSDIRSRINIPVPGIPALTKVPFLLMLTLAPLWPIVALTPLLLRLILTPGIIVMYFLKRMPILHLQCNHTHILALILELFLARPHMQ